MTAAQTAPDSSGLYVLAVLCCRTEGTIELDLPFAARVRAVPAGSRCAIVGEVSLDDWIGEAAEANLGDAVWVRDHALAHEQAVRRLDEVVARTTGTGLLPSGFGAVFSATEPLLERLERHAAAIDEFFDEIEGCREWSLRLVADVRAAAQQMVRHEAQAAGAGSGRAYLDGRRAAGGQVAECRERLRERAHDLLDQLEDSPGVRAIADRRTIAERGDGRETLAHAAILVETDRMDAFDEDLDVLAGQVEALGIDLEVTGPWPAYTFAPALGDPAANTEAHGPDGTGSVAA